MRVCGAGQEVATVWRRCGDGGDSGDGEGGGCEVVVLVKQVMMSSEARMASEAMVMVCEAWVGCKGEVQG